MKVKRLPVGVIAANCYLVWCEETKDAMVIEPGGEGERILEEIKKEGLNVKYVVDTHGHVDHIGANTEVLESTAAKLAIHQEDVPLLTDPSQNLSLYMGGEYMPSPDLILSDGDELTVGKERWLFCIPWTY